MAKAILIFGLCGSGKTYLAEQLQEATGYRVFEGAAQSSLWPTIRECLRQGQGCIVEEITLSFRDYRDHVTEYLSELADVDIEWHCFENDLDSANWNCDYREKGEADRHKEINGRVTAAYTLPPNVVPRPIFRIPKR